MPLVVVNPLHRLDLESTVVGRLGPAVFENHHAADGIAPLNVGDVVTLHPVWRGRQAEFFLKLRHCLLNDVRVIQPLDPVLCQALNRVLADCVYQLFVNAPLRLSQPDRLSSESAGATPG